MNRKQREPVYDEDLEEKREYYRKCGIEERFWRPEYEKRKQKEGMDGKTQADLMSTSDLGTFTSNINTWSNPIEQRITNIMVNAICTREKAISASGRVGLIETAIEIARNETELENIMKERNCNLEQALSIWQKQHLL
jgi:hypothetical protein